MGAFLPTSSISLSLSGGVQETSIPDTVAVRLMFEGPGASSGWAMALSHSLHSPRLTMPARDFTLTEYL